MTAAPAERPLTCRELLHDLDDIEHLIALLNAARPTEEEDIEALRWLRRERRHVIDILAERRNQSQGKVVSLARWRHGTPRFVPTPPLHGKNRRMPRGE